MQVSEFTIVDVYQRGAWLATELAQRGHKVHLIDCTESMGSWAAEDREGPFAVFHDESLARTQREMLFLPGLIENCSRGFSLRIDQNSIEFHGPTFPFAKKQFNLQESWVDRLKGRFSEAAESDWSLPSQVLAIAHQYSATRYAENTAAGGHSNMTPVALPCSVRRLGRRDHETVMQWCETHNVTVFRKGAVRDLSSSGRFVRGVEVQSADFSGYLGTGQILSFLTSYEQEWLDASLNKKVLKSHLAPQWNWMRFRISFSPHPILQSLPIHWVEVVDVDLPWTHDNFLVLNGTYDMQQWDAWMRVPDTQRFNTQYLSDLGKKVKQYFEELFGSIECSLRGFPQEYHYSFTDLGPSPFPVYEKFADAPSVKWSNWKMMGPEAFPNHDKNNLMKYLFSVSKSFADSPEQETSP